MAAICNDAEIVEDEKSYKLNGSPTERAMKAVAMKGKQNIENKRIDSIPFDSEYKYMDTLNEVSKKRIIYFKSAPSRLIDLCEYQLENEEKEKIDSDYWKSKVEEGTNGGYRMLACTYVEVDSSKENLDHEDLEEDLIFLEWLELLIRRVPKSLKPSKSVKMRGLK